MTVEQFAHSWFDPLPLNDYNELVKKAIPQNVKECPPDRTVGKPAVKVACGPNLRLLGTLENGSFNYRGTVLLVIRDENVESSSSGDESTAVSQQPSITYIIGPADEQDGSAADLQTGEFPAVLFHQEQGVSFYRYSIDLTLQSYQQKVKYSINDEFHPNFQFFVPANHQSMNVMSYSCNGFSMGVETAKFQGSMWYDVLRKHEDLRYHVMLGGGDQIYSDSVKSSSKPFEKWLKHKKIHSNTKLTPDMVQSFEEYYLNHYIKWFGKGFWEGSNGNTLQCMYPIAMHQIPQINIFDDHDIIDGFGSYTDATMRQEVFSGVGKSAFKYYLLFQHHTSPTENYKDEKSWIMGNKPGPYMEQLSRSVYARLGREVAVLGLDCRTERTKKQVVTNDTYRKVFQRVQDEINSSNGEIKHLLVMLGVPICYPRMVWAESIMSSRWIAPIRFLARKGIVAKALVNDFDGSIELLDDLNDHWCAKHHKHERNALMAKLVTLAAENGVRVTVLSGDVHLGCLSRFKTKIHKHHLGSSYDERNHEVLENPSKDPRLIFNVVSSAIINTPPPDGMASLLQKRSKIHHFDRDTDEDVVNLFSLDVDGSHRANDLFLNKRNYSDLIPFKNLNEKIINSKYSKFTEGDLIIPGPSTQLKKFESSDTVDETHAAYPLDVDSLVTTFHFEVDPLDTTSNTFDYEVLIPKLDGKQQISGVGEK
ncbi:hypothetical protein CANARDRAFT_26685 [[Candida] arabinofermentans NRRL YB-2248]|uniref:PhoD-like phosphatase domain-containing protein n=1 Tax=[Candida] arabinofermentans NRRL YB-2248 TaxID=983967 RepID=A0A1E4T681_9ASCO|nr:hypothetical protein CANARDRAFT_26685 [[Candida] arabinofermentans NRRL YB-2248]